MSTIDKEKFQFVKRDDFASETIDAPAYSYWKSVFKQFMKKKSTVVMLGILVAIILISFIYPMFSKFDFNDVSKVNDFSVRYIKPNAEHWFGTDSNGKSLFDGVWFGARNSILISVIATVINLVIGVFVGLISFIYPMFSKFDFNDVSKVNDFSVRYIKPNAEHWFGTDSNGKSLFDGVWFGARNSILISVIATVINLVIGVFVGGIWGISKSVDRVMMEVYNVISNIPPLLIVIVLTYSIGAGFWNLIFAMSVTTWIGIAFMIRVQILRYRDLEYNLASRTLGTPTLKIVAKNIMPQLVSVIVTTMTQMLPSFISYEAFLSFFGLGLPITVPSLGRLISDYSQNVTTNAYLFWIPLTTLVLVSLSLFVVGQNLADASDPRTHR
ncbi:peptide ABC transporter permease [Streptococcus pneumoniae]|nr:peptide ABC transporter permease [Streptococcus pneumoniae]